MWKEEPELKPTTVLSTALGRGARLRQRARRAGAGAGEPTPGAAPGGWVGAGMSQPNRLGLGLALQAEDKAWREDKLKLPASGIAHSLSLWVLPASPHTELPNLGEVSEIWRAPEVGEKLGLQRCLRRRCPLPGREGEVQLRALVPERGDPQGALMVMPRAMETLGFSKQGNRSCSCRAYAPAFCRERGREETETFRGEALSPSGTYAAQVALRVQFLLRILCSTTAFAHPQSASTGAPSPTSKMASVEGLRGPRDSWGALAFSLRNCLLLVYLGTLVLGQMLPMLNQEKTILL